MGCSESTRVASQTHRKMTPVATSTGWPGRSKGPLLTPAMFCSSDRNTRQSSCPSDSSCVEESMPRSPRTSAEKVECTSGVTIGPGATALTRMSFEASWFAQPRVKETIAPLVAAGVTKSGHAEHPERKRSNVQV